MMFFYFTVIVLFVLLSMVLCLTVLVQESKTSGLGASFGGEMSDSLFGTATADVLKKITAWLGGIFLALCLILSLWTSAIGRSRTLPANLPLQEAPVGEEESD